jgi:hypothetical protein
MKMGRNSLCYCGKLNKYGKPIKYKRCCMSKDQAKLVKNQVNPIQSLRQKIESGEIPFFARVRSVDGEQGGVEISHVSVTRNGQTTELLNDDIKLATNTVKGDLTSASVAMISIPIDGRSQGTIRTVGNATVSNPAEPLQIKLKDNKKDMKQKSDFGLWVNARIGLHRDTQTYSFEFIFGVQGQKEEVDETGRKNRTHISICPDGNGKFLRLAGNCEIEGEMLYFAASRRVQPNCIRIKSSDFKEILEVTFLYDDSNNIVCLEAMHFLPASNPT